MNAHLAQVNIARMLGPSDSAVMKEFFDALDQVNAAAEASPGFVWRLQTDNGNATEVRAYDDPLIIFNLTVWESPAALKDYVFKSVHGKFFARRQAWFEKMEEMHLAMWWVPAGTRPTVEEAKARLEHLRQHGDTAYAFGFRGTVSAEVGLASVSRS
jgi:hypothetical protein